jgi:tetraacyldisaccharide-1-P 4'-kinase
MKYEPEQVISEFLPDHYYYRQQDIRKYVQKSQDFDFVIITEKDYVKLKEFNVNDKFYVMQITTEMDDSRRFIDTVATRLKDYNSYR